MSRLNNLNWIELQSKPLKRVAYKNEVLYVEFNDGAQWQYIGVPEHICNALMGAKSKGTYFNQNIRGRYKCENKKV